jgi:hypothetical protein
MLIEKDGASIKRIFLLMLVIAEMNLTIEQV